MGALKKEPTLRFPGFEGEWQEKRMGEIGDVTKLAGFEFTTYVKYSDSGSIIALRGLNVKNGNLVLDEVKFIDDSDLSKLSRSQLYKDDLLFTYVGTIGGTALIPENNKYYLAPNVSRIRFDKDHAISKFIHYILINENYYNRSILPFVSSSTQPALSMGEIRKLRLYTPSLPEQQKIADCLTAMDDTIEAQQQKVEQLQAYKKGLLQQLFSQTLRFPGFEGTWEAKKLGEISEIYQPKTISQSEFTTCGFPVYGANGVIGCYSSFNHETEQIAIGCRGNCGAINLTQKKSWITGNAMVINVDKFKETINKYFLNHLLQNNNLNYMVSGSGQPQITRGDFVRHKIKIPKLIEQQKIADCLSTLDEVIELEQQKLEKLQVYKKGLLQQLFV